VYAFPILLFKKWLYISLWTKVTCTRGWVCQDGLGKQPEAASPCLSKFKLKACALLVYNLFTFDPCSFSNLTKLLFAFALNGQFEAMNPSTRCRYASRSWQHATSALGFRYGDIFVSTRSSVPTCA
jgi:hypothetical protein